MGWLQTPSLAGLSPLTAWDSTSPCLCLSALHNLPRLAASLHRLVSPGAPAFSIKEHVLISIFAQSGSAYGNGNAYAVDIVTIMRQFYGVNVSFLASFLLIATTQILGYGFAGLLRKYLVEPANMWWPYNLVYVSLFRTLHEPDRPPKGQLLRSHFFFIIMAISFAWYCVPDYFIPILTSVSWVCWVWPKSITAQQIGGGMYGLGLGAFPLDWATISAFLGSPLASPWFATANVAVGFFLACYVIMPVVYWTNTYEAQRFPILTSTLFQENGMRYPTRSILTPEITLNVTAYEQVGHPWLSGYFALGYGFGFAALTASIVHVALWNGKEIVTRALSARRESKPDVHTRLMQKYEKLPEWWFTVLLIISITAAIGCLEGFPEFQLPWWGLLVAAAMSFVFTLPIGTISATTNQTPGLNIITEMVWGYLRPGEPIGNVCFKTYGYISMTQAISFLSDFKVSHACSHAPTGLRSRSNSIVCLDHCPACAPWPPPDLPSARAPHPPCLCPGLGCALLAWCHPCLSYCPSFLLWTAWDLHENPPAADVHRPGDGHSPRRHRQPLRGLLALLDHREREHLQH